MTLSDPLNVTRNLIRILEGLEIPYFVGGSLASSLYGIPRATQDVDVVIDVDRSRLEPLCSQLEPLFFVDRQLAINAFNNRQVFNIIDKEHLFKIDLFFSEGDELLRLEMQHKVSFQLSESEQDKIFLCSAEDIIAHKLYWYKLGNNISDRQWNDVLNVLKVQKNSVNWNYLNLLAQKRGVSKLLTEAVRTLKN